jgi:DNA-binding CsgD family transcriptional regulator
MMACPNASFPDNKGALAAKRAIKRAFNANTAISHCGECDAYHVALEVGQYPVSHEWQRILHGVAEGMSNYEIADQLGMGWRGVEYAVEEMKKRFYALNRPHLIAIVIALGVVDPNRFVPKIKKGHDEQRPLV